MSPGPVSRLFEPSAPAPSLAPQVTRNLAWTRTEATLLASDAECRDSWNRLSEARGNLPFQRAECWASALSCFGTGRERLLVGRCGGEVQALFIATPRAPLLWHSFQPSQMPLGAWVAAPGLELVELAEQALDQVLSPALAFSVLQIDPDVAPRVPDGPRHEQVDYIDTGWIDIEGSFDAYWAQRSRNLRANLRKQRRRLAESGVQIECREIVRPEQMEAAVAVHARLESQGWKGSQGTAIGTDNLQGRFYLDLLERQARDGHAAVYQLLFDGRIVASNLCVMRDGCLAVLKTAYDETLDKTLSPAFLLRETQLAQLFQSARDRRLEFFGRLHDWQTQWTANRRTLHHLTCYRWPWVKALAASRRRARLAGLGRSAGPEPAEELRAPP